MKYKDALHETRVRLQALADLLNDIYSNLDIDYAVDEVLLKKLDDAIAKLENLQDSFS